MRVLVAPLNWGLGHASRCVPVVQRLLDEGNEVILGGDGDSLTLLRRHFPQLRYVFLAPLNLRYSAGNRQVWAMIKALPKVIYWAWKDHVMLRALLREETIDQVISDNRFGLYISDSNATGQPDEPSAGNGLPHCVYITHQLHIFLPSGWKWAEKIAARLHARIFARYNEVWIPDYEDLSASLAGELSHPSSPITNPQSPLTNIRYIGPLSRFSLPNHHSPLSNSPSIVALLSGLEPQRSLLEQEITTRYAGREEQLLIIRGLLSRPNTRIKRGNITLLPYLADEELAQVLRSAKHIITRSGYSTIMDLHALGLLPSSILNPQSPISSDQSSITNHQYKLELLPTPGQPEQEYLARWIEQKTLF